MPGISLDLLSLLPDKQNQLVSVLLCVYRTCR